MNDVLQQGELMTTKKEERKKDIRV